MTTHTIEPLLDEARRQDRRLRWQATVRELSRRDLLQWSALGLAAVTLCGCGATTAPLAPTGRIDVHQHMIPDTYRRWLATHGALDVGGIPVPEWSPSAAMASMNRTRTAKALLSVSAPGVTPAANEAEAEDMARTVNDVGAELAKDHPDRFGFLATLPLPALDAAAHEATRALDELSADGVILLAHSGDTYLGQPSQTDLFAELDRRHAVALVHPGPLPGPTVPGIPPLAADFLLDTTRAAYLLVRNEVVAKYPDIRFILSHAGGFLPYAADRMALVIARDTGLDPTAVRNQFRHFYFDTALSTGAATLPALLAFAEPGHTVFGSDWPFAPQAAVDRFTDSLHQYTGIDEAQRQSIDRDNAVALFSS
jgi:6-methylsalicylate decarboxylase